MTTWKKIRLLLLAGMIVGWRAGTRRSTVDPRLPRPDRDR